MTRSPRLEFAILTFGRETGSVQISANSLLKQGLVRTDSIAGLVIQLRKTERENVNLCNELALHLKSYLQSL